MAVSSFSGPILACEEMLYNEANANPERGPSLFNAGYGMMDPRPFYTFKMGQDFGQAVYGFIGTDFLTIDQIPSAISATNIAATQTPVGSTGTLVLTAGTGITGGVTIVRPDTGATVTGLLAIDGATKGVQFGQPYYPIGSTTGTTTINIWDATTSISRAVNIQVAGNDSAITYTVQGYDVYGFPMQENITGNGSAGASNGKKAFKYIQKITYAGGTPTAGITVGTTDIYGLPIRADRFAHVSIVVNNAWITANTGFVAAVTTAPTATTGDTRGTYALQTPSNGTTVGLQIFSTIPSANLATANPGIFGPTHYATF